jgi:hypothetical protein
MRRIVVHLRTCPTRLLGPYGCEWIDTPALNRLAADGVVFDGHYSPLPLGEKRGASSESTQFSYAQNVCEFDSTKITERLKQLSGQETGVLEISADPFALPWPEWDTFSIDWEVESSREDFFAACEVKIASFDKQLSELLEAMTRKGLDQSALLVFTASSGLPLGEHGIVGTANSRLHEELVHLPLIVRFPDRHLAGYRVVGFTTPDDLNENLEALILGTQPTRESVVSSREKEVSIRTADSCLILPLGDNPQPPLLYDRPDDRFEVNNLAERQSDRVEESKSKIGLNAEAAKNAENQN